MNNPSKSPSPEFIMEVTDKTRADVKVHCVTLWLIKLDHPYFLNDQSNETSLGVLPHMVLIALVLHYTSLVLYKLTGFNWILDSSEILRCHHWHEKPLCLYTVYSFEATLFYVKNFSCILFKLKSLLSGVKGLSAGLHKASIPACPLGRQLSVTFCLFCDHFLLVLY